MKNVDWGFAAETVVVVNAVVAAVAVVGVIVVAGAVVVVDVVAAAADDLGTDDEVEIYSETFGCFACWSALFASSESR